MSDGISDRLKVLAMRAKKMTAKMSEVPKSEFFKIRFAQKGENISDNDATEITRLVREHRSGKASSSSRRSKPRGKREVSEPRKTTRSYGMRI